jgi:hypothetical protein
MAAAAWPFPVPVSPSSSVREHVVPQRFAQPAHRFAFAGQRAVDEIEGAPQLEEKRQIPPGGFLAEAALHQLADHFVGERDGKRRPRLLRLPLDQRVDARHVAVVADIKQRGLDQGSLFGVERFSQPGLQPRRHQPSQRLGVLRQVTKLRLRREPHDQRRALGAEGVAEDHVGQRPKKRTVSLARHALNVCDSSIKCIWHSAIHRRIG